MLLVFLSLQLVLFSIPMGDKGGTEASWPPDSFLGFIDGDGFSLVMEVAFRDFLHVLHHVLFGKGTAVAFIDLLGEGDVHGDVEHP
jgi:hypothetical protein